MMEGRREAVGMTSKDDLNMAPLCGGGATGVWGSVERESTVRVIPAGATVYASGAVPDTVGVVESGSIRVHLTSPEGHDTTLYRVGEGGVCVLCLSSVLGRVGYPAGAEAESEVRLREVPAELFRQRVAGDEAWRDWTFHALGERLATVLGRLEETTFQRVEPRLADAILRRLPAGADRLQRTHLELAEELGSAREVISRVVGRWRSSGWVKSGRGFLEVLDRAALERVAAA